MRKGLVERLGGREAAQHAHQTRGFAGGVAPARAFVGRGGKHHLRNDFRPVGFRHHIAQERGDTGSSFVVVFHFPIRLQPVLVENRADEGGFDDGNSDIEGAHFMIERFRVPLDRMFGRGVVR